MPYFSDRAMHIAALKVLEELSIIRRAGKDGRKIVYEFCKKG